MFSYKDFYLYQEPVTYMGIEPNFQKKNISNSSLKVLFVYPDLYSVAFSSYTFRLVFDFLHYQTDSLVDCFFYPHLDYLRDLSKGEAKAYSHFYHLNISQFDLIVTTINYELQFLNFLKLMEVLGIWENGVGIPKVLKDRPYILIGGSVAFSNPALFLKAADIIYSGEIEVNGVEIFSLISKYKNNWEKLAHNLHDNFEEIIIPFLLKWQETERGIEYSFTKKRVFVEDFSHSYAPQSWIIPVSKVIHDKIYIEVMRGCTQGCRFCQAGYIYRPRRERNEEEIIELSKKYISQTGYEEISLLSLSTNSYTRIISVLEKLYLEFKDKHVNIALPSLRIDEFSPLLQEYIAKQRKTSLTFAPEAGNEKMRKIINKKITNQDIFSGIEEALKGGWSKVKLYFMIGFPNETDEDVKDIGRLLREIYFFGREINRRFQLNVSVNLFIPKPFTPFQQERLLSREEFERRIKLIIKELKGAKKIKFDWSDYPLSLMEALFSRAYPDLYDILVGYIEQSVGIYTWRDYLDLENWEEYFTNKGSDCYNFYKKIENKIVKSEFLPWELIDIGITRSFFKKEKERALQGVETVDCFKEGNCSGCGLMSFCF